ncbi:MAG: S8 family peptidase [Alphaproteobacteria bacterium]|nr:S8 family peptidase [Alphaproteobacteria bacterium]
MPNSPIQVVLNSDNFLTAREAGGGGLHKEFYENNPAEFISHKAAITKSLTDFSASLDHNEFADMGYAKLVLKRAGWAKSHRPTHSIFRHDVAPIVGAGGVGELYVELNKRSITKIVEKINQAEETVSYRSIVIKDREITKPAPSRERSELGAIEKIEPYTANDKRSFSVEQGFRWLSDSRTGGNYIIELFEIPPAKSDWDALSSEKLKLFRSFLNGLNDVGQGLVAQRITDTVGSYPMLGLRLGKSSAAPEVQILPTPVRKSGLTPFDDRIERHNRLISFLDNHPLVKRIYLPPIIKRSPTQTRVRPTQAIIPAPTENKSYPRIAVVDGGVADVLRSWVIDRWQLLAPTHRGEDHGTFIAGLVVAGGQLNGVEICPEFDGCQIVDLDILPDERVRFTEYFNSPTEFLDELATAVQTLKARTGVRIFNFSMNFEQAVESDSYHPFSRRLDQIAQENDVIFIISAGNTVIDDMRPEWPENTLQALATLATARNDRLRVPSESVRNISVAAVNPPNVYPAITHAPAAYSCRGPGNRIGIKPDLAHIGGCGTPHAQLGHGLFSIAPDGAISDGCGTSYAAPLVAKMLSSLDHSIEGDVSRETLMALATHHACLPDILSKKELKDVARHLVGFGIPSSTADILEGNEHQITLVFANRLKHGKLMRFGFSWPRSLVKDGKCLGTAKLTLVSTPPLDYKYGVEFVRINIDAALRQEQKDGGFVNRLKPIYLPEMRTTSAAEADLIEYGFKWSPVKAYAKTFKNGVGPSTNWHLDVEYLLRDGEEMPENGVPFTALLTISDHKKAAPVFNDVRQMLQSVGVETTDIKTAARILARI